MKNTGLLAVLAFGLACSSCRPNFGVAVSASGCRVQKKPISTGRGCDILVQGTGIGYALDGWIERNCRRGRIRILAGGRSAILHWMAAERRITGAIPRYIADCEVAATGPELFNQDFEQYYEVTTTNGDGARIALDDVGLQYSDIVLPAW